MGQLIETGTEEVCSYVCTYVRVYLFVVSFLSCGHVICIRME